VLRCHSVKPLSVQNWTTSVIAGVREALSLRPYSFTSASAPAYLAESRFGGGGARRAPGDGAVSGITNAIA
jgi:hypothetical protein